MDELELPGEVLVTDLVGAGEVLPVMVDRTHLQRSRSADRKVQGDRVERARELVPLRPAARDERQRERLRDALEGREIGPAASGRGVVGELAGVLLEEMDLSDP